jgi:hypothetical protein
MASLQVCSGLRFCPHCRQEFKVRLSSDIGVRLHWVGEQVCFDVDFLLFELFPECSGMLVLYREVYSIVK